jgi:hypothetical protein
MGQENEQPVSLFLANSYTVKLSLVTKDKLLCREHNTY